MMKFIYQFDDDSPLIEVTLSSDSVLSEVLLSFRHFLQAATYPIKDNEYLDVVDETSDEITKE